MTHDPHNQSGRDTIQAGRDVIQVGGDYIFVHRMLLEYFAGLESEQQREPERRGAAQ